MKTNNTSELLALGQVNGWRTYTCDDGVHLNEKGNAVLAQGIFDILKKQLSKRRL